MIIHDTHESDVYRSAGYEVDLRELFHVLWNEKWLIAGITSVAAVISIVVSMMVTEIYRAESVLVPADTDQNGGALASIGGAAALLGVNLNTNSGDGISSAIATLRSYQFLSRFIERNNLLIPLFASSWDKREQRAVIDERIYNLTSNEWLRKDGKPTALEAFRLFSSLLSVIGPDRSTGIVTVAITWHNPEEAASWVNQLVLELNKEVRSRDVREANSAIDFLSKQLENTQLIDMQRVFYQLIESQTRITMLADVREEYVFRVIDPAVVPDHKSGPRRSLICIIGTALGVILSLVVLFIRRMLRVGKDKSGCIEQSIKERALKV